MITSDSKKTHKTAKTPQEGWYAKLHPIGVHQQTTRPKRLLNLSIFFRVWLAVALVLMVCGLVIFTQLFGYVKPTAQQVIEDTLLDTGQILAANLQVPLLSGALFTEGFQKQLDSAFIDTPTTSKTTGIKTTRSRFHIYITDDIGKVIYDSKPMPNNAEGEDYSRWNDVYLTLQGQYGARSTTNIDNQRDSAIMYVAQPIHDDLGAIIGVVSVGKPIDSVLPYLDNTRQRMLLTALLISIAALILAGLIAWWLKQSISLVTRYTGALAEDTKKPYFYLGQELNSLTDTIETMKHRLENRAYVSDYVHTLTHELKSPLTAIRACSELLEDNNLDDNDKQMLSKTVTEQSVKMQQLIDRLLLLAKVEQPTFKLNRQALPLLPLLNSVIKNSHPQLQQRHLAPIEITLFDKSLTIINDVQTINKEQTAQTTLYADAFWLVQALQNVLDNAIYFAESQVSIHISHHQKTVHITVFNDGKSVPDYAIDKVFNRYFSLSHHSQTVQNHTANHTPKKGTGLGLTLVKQVIEHHGGTVCLQNVGTMAHQHLAGVQICITLPTAAMLSTIKNPLSTHAANKRFY